MAAELVIGPILGLLLLGWGVFFASVVLYRRQQREERFEKLRAHWEGIFRAPGGQRLAILWHEKEGWIVSLDDATPSTDVAHFRAQLRGDTLTVTLGASGVALDLRFLEGGVLVSPLVPGLHGDASLELGWLAVLLQGSVPRWQREPSS